MLHAGRWSGGIDRPMESTSLTSVHVKLPTTTGVPAVQSKSTRSKGTGSEKIRFALTLSDSTVRSVPGRLVSTSKKLWRPS